jgi:hypothetical protein
LHFIDASERFPDVSRALPPRRTVDIVGDAVRDGVFGISVIVLCGFVFKAIWNRYFPKTKAERSFSGWLPQTAMDVLTDETAPWWWGFWR